MPVHVRQELLATNILSLANIYFTFYQTKGNSLSNVEWSK